jgi:hypothetical protein
METIHSCSQLEKKFSERLPICFILNNEIIDYQKLTFCATVMSSMQEYLMEVLL